MCSALVFFFSVPSGEILEAVVAENNLTEAIAVKYLSQLLHAVDTLHKIKIAHLDIRVSLTGENGGKATKLSSLGINQFFILLLHRFPLILT